MSTSPKYRHDVTGLRALAVAAVVLFHLWPTSLSGGFLGVDVFFVISGFVVCRAYLDDAIVGQLRFREFFWRRVRRLLPAAAAVTLASWVVALALLEPEPFYSFSQTLGAQAGYFQNFVFWWQGDYFEDALERPLLHTWSLAVEEQFYLFFPVLVLLLRRAGKRRDLVLWSLFALSLIAALLIARVSPKTAFFLAPTRAWQFVLGALAVRWEHRVASVAGWLGVGMVLVGLACFGEDAPFPGIHTALVSLGTTAVLVARPSAVARTLSLGGARWLGDRSYSLYLVHWPLLSFAHFAGWQSEIVRWSILALSVLLADLSFRWIEDPVRRGTRLNSTRALGWFSLGALAAVIGAATLGLATEGLPQRYPEPSASLFLAARLQNHGRCGLVREPPACLVSDDWGPGGVLVVGDSHADAIDEALAREGNRRRHRVFLADTACDLWNLAGNKFRCGDSYRRALVHFSNQRGVTSVIFVSSWSDFDDEHSDRALEVLRAFDDSGLNTFVSGPLPRGGQIDPAERARAFLSSPTHEPLLLGRREQDAAFAPARDFLSQLPETTRVLAPESVLCDDHVCFFDRDGVPLYFDTNHLSSRGAELVVARVYAPVWAPPTGP